MVIKKDLDIIFSSCWEQLQALKKLHDEQFQTFEKSRQYKAACKAFSAAVEGCKG